jgi:hypothetical protein
MRVIGTEEETRSPRKDALRTNSLTSDNINPIFLKFLDDIGKDQEKLKDKISKQFCK